MDLTSGAVLITITTTILPVRLIPLPATIAGVAATAEEVTTTAVIPVLHAVTIAASEEVIAHRHQAADVLRVIPAAAAEATPVAAGAIPEGIRAHRATNLSSNGSSLYFSES
jgi:hypothetical protein